MHRKPMPPIADLFVDVMEQVLRPQWPVNRYMESESETVPTPAIPALSWDPAGARRRTGKCSGAQL